MAIKKSGIKKKTKKRGALELPAEDLTDLTEAIDTIKICKATLGVGLTVQIEQYEPIKLYASEEVTYKSGTITDDDVSMGLAKKVTRRLDDLAPEIALKLEEIKQNILKELSED